MISQNKYSRAIKKIEMDKLDSRSGWHRRKQKGRIFLTKGHWGACLNWKDPQRAVRQGNGIPVTSTSSEFLNVTSIEII